MTDELKERCQVPMNLILQKNKTLGPGDPCPYCKDHLIAYHIYVPSLSAADNNTSQSSGDKGKDGSKSILPSWHRGKVVHTFLNRYEQVLVADQVDRKHWPRLLLKAVNDVHEASWIQRNIVEVELDWDAARKLFLQHFESSSYLQKLIFDYHDIKQSDRESVQQYSNKFTSMVDELNYNYTDPHVINHFMLTLKPKWLAEIRKRIKLKKFISGSDHEFNSLKEIIDLAIEIEIDQVTLDQRLSSSNNHHINPSSNPSRGNINNNNSNNNGNKYNHHGNSSHNTNGSKGIVKHCVYHPSSTTHTTAECSHNPSRSSINSGTPSHSDVKPPTGSSSSVSDRKGYLPKRCHLCNSTDHWANTCPKRSIIQTRSGSSGPTGDGNNTNPRPTSTGNTNSGNMVKPYNTTTMNPSRSSSHHTVEHKAADITSSGQSEDADEQYGMVVVERTPSESLFTSPLEGVVMISFNGLLFNAFMDTGASVSFVEETLVHELELKAEGPQYGRIHLAHANSSMPRIGTTQMDVEIIFPGEERASIPLQGMAFEIMPMRTSRFDYHFTLGRDILEVIFPHGIPPKYFQSNKRSQFQSSSINNNNSSHSHHSGIVSSVPDDLSIANGDRDSDHSIIPVPTVNNGRGFNDNQSQAAETIMECRAMDINDISNTSHSNIISARHTNHASSSTADPITFNMATIIAESKSTEDDEVITFSPPAVPPDILDQYPLVELFTSQDDKVKYDQEREALLQHLQTELYQNSQITGFCSIPESTVLLTIDPSKSNKLRRFQYPIAHQMKEATTKIINRWLDEKKVGFAPPGCIYNNPITVVPKRDDDNKIVGYRPCLDVRELNKVLTVNDHFLIPHIRAELEKFAGCLVLSELDLQEAYLQFKLDESCRNLTAFTWNGKQYVFHGCPFGLTLLTSHFQRIMVYIFHDLPFVVPYIDNIIFGSKSWQEHREHLKLIIDRLNQVNLRLKQDFSKVGHSELKCLGHVISRRGVSVDPVKIDTILQWPVPTTPKELQSFLGFCGFVRQHIRHYAELSSYLESIKNESFIDSTTTDFQDSFHALKCAVATAPILSYPEFDRHFEIATDASLTGVGGVLFQPSSDEEHITPNNIVAICSKKLTESQRRWPTYKKELFGVVYSLRKFHAYIWGRSDVVVHTDHKPLTYIFSSVQLSMPLQYWLDVLLEYQPQIKHRDGILNVVPDTLSRMYSEAGRFTEAYSRSPVWGVDGSFDTASIDMRGIIDSPKNPRQNSKKQGERETVDVSDIINHTTDITEELYSFDPTSEHPTTSTWENTVDLAERSSIDLLCYAASVSMSNEEVAIELEKRGKKAPATEEEKQYLIDSVHALGHFGREAMFLELWRQGYWWPLIRSDIDAKLKDCDSCIRYVVVKSGFNPAKTILANGPGDHFQIDLAVHLPESPEGYKNLLVCIDVFTGFIVLRSLKEKTAEEVASELWKIFSLIGFPRILQSDNGSEFVNDLIHALCKLTGIEQRFISEYNPRADGKVERSIGTVMNIIKKSLHGRNRHWPEFVSFAQMAFNNKISSLTGSSPFALMFGRNMNAFKDYSNSPEDLQSVEEWKAYQDKIVSLIYPAVSQRIKSGRDKMIKSLNQHRKILLPSSLPKGATVMIKDPMKNDKFEPTYIGPYIIEHRSRGGAYILKDATGNYLDRRVPPDQIKLISKKTRTKDKNIHEVDYIADHRDTNNGREYLIHWKGWDIGDRTWEPERHILDNTVVREYWKELKDKEKVISETI